MLGRDQPHPVLTAGDAKTGTGMNAATFVEAISVYHKVADGPHLQTRHRRRYESLSVDVTSLVERDPIWEHLMTVSGIGPIVSASSLGGTTHF
jgi:hypothetical protein